MTDHTPTPEPMPDEIYPLNNKRWTQKQRDNLKAELCFLGRTLPIARLAADCIGSTEFDLVDAKADLSRPAVGGAVLSFDMGAPEGDTSFLMIGLKRPDGSFETLHGVYGAEAEALYRALNMVPALKAALAPQPPAEDLLRRLKYALTKNSLTDKERISDALLTLKKMGA